MRTLQIALILRMPYIAPEARPQYDEIIKSLAATIREATQDQTKRAGHLNYQARRRYANRRRLDLRIYEIKFDGYHALALSGGSETLEKKSIE